MTSRGRYRQEMGLVASYLRDLRRQTRVPTGRAVPAADGRPPFPSPVAARATAHEDEAARRVTGFPKMTA